MPDPTPTLTDELHRFEQELSRMTAYRGGDVVGYSMTAEQWRTFRAAVARMVADAEQRGRAEVSAAVEAVLGEATPLQGGDLDGMVLVEPDQLRAALADPAAAVVRIKAEAWDEAVRECHDLGWMHDYALSDVLERNPYRTGGHTVQEAPMPNAEKDAPDLYICPTTGETESRTLGGFDVCCDHPRCPGNLYGTRALDAIVAERVAALAEDEALLFGSLSSELGSHVEHFAAWFENRVKVRHEDVGGIQCICGWAHGPVGGFRPWQQFHAHRIRHVLLALAAALTERRPSDG